MNETLKFISSLDAQRFCLEESLSFDNIVESDDTFTLEVPEDLLERRRATKSRVKDLNKSRTAKKNWRLNKRNYLRGIRKYHKSTKGKRFHRKLGRLMATRDYKRADEWLIGVQSLLTHMCIEETFASSTDDEIEFELLHEEVRPVLNEFCDTLVRLVHEGGSIDPEKFSEGLEILEDLISGANNEETR